MRLGVDASNIREGGGVTHLACILAAADPPAHGISSVAVWTSTKTAAQLPQRPWLRVATPRSLDAGLPRRIAWQRFELGRAAREACDLLWVPGGNAMGGFRPFVTMCRNMLPFEPAERRRYGLSMMGLRIDLLSRTQSRAFRAADGVIFLTEYARRQVTARVGGIPGTVATIPHGVDERFRLAPRPQRPIEACTLADPFRVVAISIVDVYKHPWVIAEAVVRLRAKGLPVHLDLIGPAYGPALVRLRETLARFDPEGRAVTYTGKVPFTALHAAYHASEVFVFASSCENMPNILLEAMSAGLPIACSDRGPMPEILGDGGSYFDPETVDAAAEAIERLVASPETRARCAAIAFRRASAYSWKRCADETMRFLASFPVATRRAS
jgi:glycosyltransferase involved in cell wall biosynthesis